MEKLLHIILYYGTLTKVFFYPHTLLLLNIELIMIYSCSLKKFTICGIVQSNVERVYVFLALPKFLISKKLILNWANFP